MIAPRITALYAVMLATIFLVLSVRIAVARWRREQYFGEADSSIAMLVRAHSNFVENIPIALILLSFAEVRGAAWNVMHGLASALVVSRVLHAYGVSKEPEPIWFRVCGYTLTCIIIGGAAVTILYQLTTR